MCKTHYLQTIKKELNGSVTYEDISHIADTRQKEILDYCAIHGLHVSTAMSKFPYIYLNPKLHKNPLGYRYIAASASCSTKLLSQLITVLLKKLLVQRRQYCKVIQETRGIHTMWIIDNTSPFLSMLQGLSKKQKARTISTFDFSTLYTKIPHEDLKETMSKFVKSCYKGSKNKYLSLRKKSLGNKNAKVYWTKQLPKKKSDKEYYVSCETLISHINKLIDNIYVTFGDKVFQQIIGIPMGTDCAPLLANIYLHMYEFEFMIQLQKENIKRAHKFCYTMRYIDDLATVNNEYFEKDKDIIYPKALILNKENISIKNATFLDTDVEILKNKSLRISIYDKRDDFPFEINTYPYPQSKIVRKNAINVFISQAIGICRICNHEKDFHKRNHIVMKKMIKNGFQKHELIKTFKKFTHKHVNEILKYKYSPRLNGLYIKKAFG
jgi:hypothetical protein